MNLDQEILNVLVEAGAKGLKIEKIARHVYNSCNSIFNPLSYETVHAYVTQYLIKCSKNPKSIIEKGKGVGVYHVNYKSEAIMQLMLDFSSTNVEQQESGVEAPTDNTESFRDLFDNAVPEKSDAPRDLFDGAATEKTKTPLDLFGNAELDLFGK